MATIDVVNAADATYVPHTAAMLHSLFAHNPDESFHVYFLHGPGMRREPLTRLAALCAEWHAEFTPTLVGRERLGELPIAGQYPQEAWYRVVLPEVLTDVPRALWLDADVIVLSRIRELWDVDLDGLPLAACPNAVTFNFRDVIRNIGIADRTLYFNSGVMLLDLERMRREGAPATLRQAAERAKDWIRFADQDVLNIVYHQRYKRLPLAWNVLSHTFINVPETVRVHGRREFDEAMATPRILHFTGPHWHRPWHYTCSHPHRDEYLRHRAAAGWPPPAFPDKSLRSFLVRQIPLRLREVLASLRGRKYALMLSYLRPW